MKEKSEAIQVGNFIMFNNQDTVGEFVKVKVLKKTLFNDVTELLSNYDVERIMPGHTKEELKDLMNKIYGDELLKKQIVTFEFEYLQVIKNLK